MTSNLKVIVISLVFSLAIIVGGAALLSSQKQPPARENQSTAAMTIDKTIADLGDMKTDEEKSASFTITNTSQSTLRIWNVATSCDCTFAKIKIGDTEAGEFNMPMHMNASLKNWLGEVPAGDKAELTVTYRPKIMPVTGKITRQVTFDTNDPKNPKIEVSIDANVL